MYLCHECERIYEHNPKWLKRMRARKGTPLQTFIDGKIIGICRKHWTENQQKLIVETLLDESRKAVKEGHFRERT